MENFTITEFMESDHKRLDDLLEKSFADPEHIDHESYDAFRQGLLKHIGLEEKILFPMAQKLRGGDPLPQAAKLRLDHGAIASLLTPAPSQQIAFALRTVLAKHNPLEEGPNGVYEECRKLLGEEADNILLQLKSAKDVPVATRIETDKLWEGVRRSLVRAGFSESLIDPGVANKSESK